MIPKMNISNLLNSFPKYKLQKTTDIIGIEGILRANPTGPLIVKVMQVKRIILIEGILLKKKALSNAKRFCMTN